MADILKVLNIFYRFDNRFHQNDKIITANRLKMETANWNRSISKLSIATKLPTWRSSISHFVNIVMKRLQITNNVINMRLTNIIRRFRISVTIVWLDIVIRFLIVIIWKWRIKMTNRSNVWTAASVFVVEPNYGNIPLYIPVSVYS